MPPVEALALSVSVAVLPLGTKHALIVDTCDCKILLKESKEQVKRQTTTFYNEVPFS